MNKANKKQKLGDQAQAAANDAASSSSAVPAEPSAKQQAVTIFRAFQSCLKSYDEDHFGRFFVDHCAASIVLSVLHIAKEAQGPEKLTVYREIHGFEAVQSFLTIEQLVFPDGVGIYQMRRVEAAHLPDGEEAVIVHADFYFEGHKVYTMDVSDLSSAYAAAESVASALSSLVSLSSHQSTPSSSSSSSSSSSTSPLLLQEGDCAAVHEEQQHSQPEGLHRRCLDSMELFVSTEQARYFRGQKMLKDRHITVRGTMQLTVDSRQKIRKIKYTA